MNAALITKSNNRILQEIQHGFKSKAYKMIIPYIGGLQSPNIVYVKFNKDSGFYAGQDHILEIKFQWGNPINHYYPFHPPLMTFKTPIWHPNISGFPGGAICLDFLKQEGLWSATCTVEGLIEMIKAMMDDPNPNSPQNPDAGKSYSESIKTKTWGTVCSNYYKQHIKSCADIFDTFVTEQDETSETSETRETPKTSKKTEPDKPEKLTISKVSQDDSDSSEEQVVKKVVKKDKKVSKPQTDVPKKSNKSNKSKSKSEESTESTESTESEISEDDSDDEVPKEKTKSKKIVRTPIKISNTIKAEKSKETVKAKKITFKKKL